MARKSRNTRRRSARRNRSRRSTNPFTKLFLSGSTLALVLGGVGYITWQDAGYIKPDTDGCYINASASAHTVAIVDSSDPRFDQSQNRDLLQAFRQLFNSGLAFNERLSVITTAERSIGSVPKPVLSFCKSARTSVQLEAVGAASVTSSYLQRQSRKFNDKVYEPEIAKVFDTNPDTDRRQSRESPILEQVQSVARLASFSPDVENRRLILVSDLIQVTQEAQFCFTKGHLPSFTKFKTTPYYNRIKPASLSGVRVTIYMLIRGGYETKPIQYCSEDELRSFWIDYFTDAGAASVDVIRLRNGRADSK